MAKAFRENYIDVPFTCDQVVCIAIFLYAHLCVYVRVPTCVCIIVANRMMHGMYAYISMADFSWVL